jgi:ornithine cyclodeaminase
LSKEFRDYFAEDDVAWARVLPVSGIVGGAGRPVDADLTIFKAMGMGVSDLALGLEIYSRAVKAGRGRAFKSPERVAPRLCARVQIKELC